MRSRGGATGKAAGPLHLDLPAFPTSLGLLEAPMFSPQGPRPRPCSGPCCSVLCTVCSSQRKPPRVSWRSPCFPRACLAHGLCCCLLESSRSFQIHLHCQSVCLSGSAQTDVVSFFPNPCDPLSSEGSLCLVRNVSRCPGESVSLGFVETKVAKEYSPFSLSS